MHLKLLVDDLFGLFGIMYQSGSLCEGVNNFLVVTDVGEGECPTFAVFEPFLGRLIATDKEIPRFYGYIPEVLRVVNIDFAVLIA